jgi:hypothetical protein
VLLDNNSGCPVQKICIISYLFSPVGGIGVQRALSLARYLPQCGFEVYILKATNAGGPVRDPELVKLIPPGVKVREAFRPGGDPHGHGV